MPSMVIGLFGRGMREEKAKSERKAVKYKKIAKSRRKGYRNKLANSGRNREKSILS